MHIQIKHCTQVRALIHYKNNHKFEHIFILLLIYFILFKKSLFFVVDIIVQLLLYLYFLSILLLHPWTHVEVFNVVQFTYINSSKMVRNIILNQNYHQQSSSTNTILMLFILFMICLSFAEVFKIQMEL